MSVRRKVKILLHMTPYPIHGFGKSMKLPS